MHYVSHRCRWMDNPLASHPMRWWERLADALRCAFRPRIPTMGRDRIDPYLPWGHWAAGWERPALPPTFSSTKRPQAAGTTCGHVANRLATIRLYSTANRMTMQSENERKDPSCKTPSAS